jgi:diacylglycerol kinase family enzyme
MLDGEHVECEGLTCMIANAGSAGRSGFSLSKHIDVGDGLLDVLVVRKADLASLLSVASSIASGGEEAEPVQHWQVREVTVEAEPPQTVQADGEVLGETPVTAKIIPSAVKVVVPRPAEVAGPGAR